MGTSDPGSHEFVGPNEPIPLAPMAAPAAVLRRALTGLREPTFRRARRGSLGWAAGTVAVVVAAGTVVEPSVAPAVQAVGLLMAVYTVARVAMLTHSEHRQRTFERDWLNAQSRMLRTQLFDVVRFRIRETSDGPSSNCRTVDLTSTDDVARLLRQQELERHGQPRSRAYIEFAYPSHGAGNLAIESVRRQLREIEFYPVESSPGHARIRFPDAVYGGRPATPGRLTYWFLTGQVRVTSGLDR